MCTFEQSKACLTSAWVKGSSYVTISEIPKAESHIFPLKTDVHMVLLTAHACSHEGHFYNPYQGYVSKI